MIVVQSVHRTPPPPTRPRVWTPNDAGLFVPDIELTDGGIYVSSETMDEVEAAARARGDGKTTSGMIWYRDLRVAVLLQTPDSGNGEP